MMRFSVLMLCLGLGGLPAVAQETAETNDDGFTFPSYDDFERRFQRTLSGSREKATEGLARMMLELAPEGNVTLDNIALKRSLLQAEMRARRMADLLKYDIDFDGNLNQDELQIVYQDAGRSRNKAQIVVMMSRADGNANSVLEMDELLASVRDQVTLDKNRTRYDYEELMKFDLNGDGVASVAEMILAVDQIKLNCDC